ncbi:MAG: hypothetical protein CR968_00375 [Flavobacteriia bacterium]|nr:MAG: hypothetical protein CR968_00375 [Flavobacteriia bacterium]
MLYPKNTILSIVSRDFILIAILSLFFAGQSKGQETLPVYTDYMTDNVYLIHPAAAGIGNCSKLRLTARQQWMGQDEAPQLQTLSTHIRVSKKTGIGIVAFNDKNGYHAQVGGQLTYAYHLRLSEEVSDQLSFGISAMGVRNTLDERDFVIPDPIINQQINSTFYVNADAGVAYHRGGLFSYFTAKNLLLSPRNQYNAYESLNLRRYLLTLGYYINKEDAILQYEPSVMFQYVEHTKEKFMDFNIKIYKPFDNGSIWGGLSYRRGLDSGTYEAPNYFTPVFGVNYKKFVVSYSYTKQQNNILFDNGGFHQITLGFDFLCRDYLPRLSSCPNLSGSF